MDIDKIPNERLFLNNTEEELKLWCKNLRYFHYIRARGGHNCEGDSFCVYFGFDGLDELITRLDQIGVKLNKLEEGFIAFDPFESYSFDDLDKLKMVIPQSYDLEQPQYVNIFGHKVHVWIMPYRFEISVSGTKDNKTYKVSDEDFEVCLALEKHFDELGWNSILDTDITKHAHCISKDKYPELF